MLPLAGMGVPFRITPGTGPVIDHPVRTKEAVERLRILPVEEATPYVLDAVRLLRSELGERAALLGFAGAPFTLACYLIEGRPTREYPLTKAMMLGRPDLWHQLMYVLTEVTIRYLRGQIEAGADVVQLFDSWLGLLSPSHYERFVCPYTRRIFAAIGELAPAIHFSTGTGHLLPLIAATGPAMVSVDWRVPLDVAWAQIGACGIQGNLDPTVLLAPAAVVEVEARDVLRRAAARPGHIFNLGHGILPQTDPDQLARLVDLAHTTGLKSPIT
jgi:uroporphyrinogen decarboxylase